MTVVKHLQAVKYNNTSMADIDYMEDMQYIIVYCMIHEVL